MVLGSLKEYKYYVKKEHELREIYRSRCMHHLTLLDYTALESGGRKRVGSRFSVGSMFSK